MKVRKRISTEEIVSEVRTIYAELEGRHIERNCTLRTECCYFKITGLTPQVTAGEALLAAKAWRASGRREIKPREDGGCPMLTGKTGVGKCAIYKDRPFGCRTHFCREAGGAYSRKEVVDLVHRLESVDSMLAGTGARDFISALEDALKRV